MTSDKAKKKAIRARMEVTGEPYTVAARRHDQEQAEARSAATTLIVPKPRCPRCTEGSLVFNDWRANTAIHCSHCQATWASGIEAAEEYAGEVLGLSSYSAAMNGDREPVEGCPECNDLAVVWADYENTGNLKALCFTCGEVWNDTCMRCDRPIVHMGEGDLMVCTVCWDDVVGRD